MRWLAAFFALVLAGVAWAEAADGVLERYRAYRAALDAGNLATAEAEAEAALAASVARDGDGGRTAVLAMNLAQVRLDRGRAAEAHAPARQAFEIASRNADAGVDPLAARLALGRAELAVDGPAGARRLTAALPEAAARADLGGVYAAAAALGAWEFDRGDYPAARRAWAVAGDAAAGASASETFARAEARLFEGASIVLFNLGHDARVETGTRIGRIHDYQPAEDAFAEAERLAGPLAYDAAPVEGLTRPQSVYAQARAWRRLLRIRLGRRERVQARSVEFEHPGRAPVCSHRLIAGPAPAFPVGAAQYESVGVVVMRLVLNEDGRIIDSRVGAAIPERWFAGAVNEVAPRWRFERDPMSPMGCVAPRIEFVTVTFTYDD